MRIVVIGGGAGGMSAAARAKRANPSSEVIVYEEGKYLTFGLCGIPYYISGKVKDLDDLIALSDQDIEKRGIKFFRFHRAIEVKPHKKQIIVRDIKNRETISVEYDRLVISSGAEAIKIPGIEGENVFYLRTLDDAEKIKNFISINSPKKAVILGGGYIGMEMADAFHSIGMDVTIIEKLHNILPQFDPDISYIARKKLEENGIEVRTGETAKGADKNTLFTDKEEINFDLLLVSTGVKPRTELVKSARLDIGKFGGIKVDSRMRTSQFSLFAAGDCIEVKHMVTGKDVYIPLGTTANKTGKVAGDNAAGGNLQFRGISGTGIFRGAGFDMAITGITENEAKNSGIGYKTATITALNKAHYYPDAEKITVKVIFTPNGKLLGSQMIGRGVERINIFATALRGNLSIEEMAGIDLAYSPPFAPVWDPVLIAVNKAIKEVG